MSVEKSVAVFGVGPAGISTVRSLSERGHKITWIFPEQYTSPRSIYTTATEFPPLNKLINPDHKVELPFVRMINNRGADVRVSVDGKKYFMIQNQAFACDLLSRTEHEAEAVHVEKLPQRVINAVRVVENKNGTIVEIDGNRQTYDAVVDATGVHAAISSQVEKSRHQENFLVEYIYGARFLGHLEKPEIILVVGPAGGTCYVCPSADDRNSIDVVYTAYGPYKDFSTRFLPEAGKRLDVLITFLQHVTGISFASMKIQDVYCGAIREQSTKKPISENVYAVGEAAGMARPGTGQSFDRSFRAGHLVAEAIDSGCSPAEFYLTWKSIWNDALFLSAAIARLSRQKKGELGTTFDRLHSIAAGNNEQAIQKAVEFVVDNKISAEVLLYLFTDLKLLSSLILALSKYMEVALKGPENSGIEWSLPPVSAY